MRHLLAEVQARTEGGPVIDHALAALQQSRARLAAAKYGEDIDVTLADCRYSFVHELARGQVAYPPRCSPNRSTFSDRVDRVIDPSLPGAFPFFWVLMWVVFQNHHRHRHCPLLRLDRRA